MAFDDAFRRDLVYVAASLMRALCVVVLVGCVNYSVDSLPPDPIPETPTWQAAATLHGDEPLLDRAAAGMQHGHSLWLSASNMNRIGITISARAVDGDSVRLVVLGPSGELLGADGVAEPLRNATVTLEIATPGEYIVLAGSHDLATATAYELTATCSGCGVSRIDALATPKAGALVGDMQRHIPMVLGDMLVGRDVEVELWASPPMQWWNGELVALARGAQLDTTVPSAVRPGDDLLIVMRDESGRVIDTGVRTRYAPQQNAFARTDRVLYGDTLRIAGVVGYFEGVAELRLLSETRQLELAHDVVRASKPGQEGNGLGAFDATFTPTDAEPGELVSIGVMNGNGEYRRLGCFEFAGEPRECP